MKVLAEIKQSVIAGKAEEVREFCRRALESGTAPMTVINDGLIEGMTVVGQRFKANEIYVPEVLLSSRAMNFGLEVIKPHLGSGAQESAIKIVMGTVKDDIHDIGKNMVNMMMEGAGIEVIDLGVDVSAEKFVEAVEKHQPVALGMSALLTTTMPNFQEVIDGLEKAGLRDKVKVLIGGAPVTQAYADEIGADGYGADAVTAVQIVKQYAAKRAS